MSEHTSVHELFEAQVQKSIGALALIFDGELLSYSVLNERANRLAHYLGRLGVTTGTRVGIYMGRCTDAVVTVMAILKAGAIYVPLDPAYPLVRLEHMVATTTPVVIVTKNCNGQIFENPCDHVVDVEAKAVEIRGEPTEAPVLAERSRDAYVLFTSGSTGHPRGVLGHQAGIINRIHWMLGTYPLQGKEVFCLRASLNFVDAVWDVFQPLLSGCPLVVMPEWAMENHESFLTEIQRWEVSRLSIAPAHLRSLLHYEPHLGKRLASLRILDITGEQISCQLARQTRQAFPKVVMLNRYGCTEAPSTMIFDLASYQEELHGELVPIGKEIDNTTVHLLGSDMQEVRDGQVGELCISGAQVATGYCNEPELTAKRFVNIILRGEERRVYCTGDLARRAMDGNVLCLGRQDGQVKIRGNRVEIDEVEAVVSAHPEVEHGAVVLDGKTGEERLKAFFVPNVSKLIAEDLRAWLRARLPEYMVPSLIIPLHRLPLLPSGKIDRQSLSALSGPTNPAGHMAPCTSTEFQIAEWVQELCCVDHVSTFDNFFDLGLDSLSAMQLLARLQRAYGVNISMQTLFAEPCVAALARLVATEEPRGPIPVAVKRVDSLAGPSGTERRFPMSYAQRLLWRLDQRLGRWRHLYNDAWAIRLRGDLDIVALEGAINDLVKRQAVLRTNYATEGEEEIQLISEESHLSLDHRDLSHLPDREQTRVIAEWVAQQRYQHFDLAGGSLLRGVLICTQSREHVLLLATHHITEDAWSGRVINRDLSELYNARLETRPHRLPELRRSYAEYSLWQEQMVQRGAWDEQLRYWKHQLAGKCVRPPRLLDRAMTADNPSFAGAEEALAVPKAVTDVLWRLASQEKVTRFMALLAVLYVTLYRYTNSEDLVIGSPIAHRHYEGVEDLVGFFPNMLAFRQVCHHDMTFRQLLRSVRGTALAAYANQDLPLVRLADALGEECGPHHPLVTMTFIMPGQNPRLGETLKLNGAKVELVRVEGVEQTAKFDFNLSAIDRAGSGSLALEILYNRSLFEPESIKRLLALYVAVLQDVGFNEDMPLGSIGI
jgi:amino acid adenylation domain-containing protein